MFYYVTIPRLLLIYTHSCFFLSFFLRSHFNVFLSHFVVCVCLCVLSFGWFSMPSFSFFYNRFDGMFYSIFSPLPSIARSPFCVHCVPLRPVCTDASDIIVVAFDVVVVVVVVAVVFACVWICFCLRDVHWFSCQSIESVCAIVKLLSIQWLVELQWHKKFVYELIFFSLCRFLLFLRIFCYTLYIFWMAA